MKAEEIKALIDTNTSDEGVNYDAIGESFNKFTNDLLAKKKFNKEEYSQQVLNDYRKEIGYDSHEALLESLKSTDNSKELDELRGKHLKEIAELKQSYSNYDDILNENKQFKQGKALEQIQVIPDFAEYVTYEASKLIDENVDFPQALEKLKETHPQYFIIEKPKKPFQFGSNMSTQVRRTKNEKGTFGFEDILKAKGKL